MRTDIQTLTVGNMLVTISIDTEEYNPIALASLKGTIQGAVERYRQSLPQVIQEKQSGCRGCGDK